MFEFNKCHFCTHTQTTDGLTWCRVGKAYPNHYFFEIDNSKVSDYIEKHNFNYSDQTALVLYLNRR